MGVRMDSHLVMVFVGNGFDIAVLKKYGKSGVTTSYRDFYDYFIKKYPDAEDNILIQQMEKAKKEGKVNWSDFEAALFEYITTSGTKLLVKRNTLYRDLKEIQNAFSIFLNETVNSCIIDAISEDEVAGVNENITTKGYRSLSRFLGDLSENQYQKCRFHNEVDNNEIIKFLVFNFNYTALLDNYLYLDRDTFDPEPYKTSKNNFNLFTNPNKYEGNMSFPDPYMRLSTQVIHPHGHQNIPKSLLFGIELDKEDLSVDDWRRRFVKSFWARSKELYDHYFEDTELFIIFGCSLGLSDRWWWRRIFNRIKAEDGAELIIYKYGQESEENIKDLFFKGCCLNEQDNKYISIARKNIYVVSYDDKSKLKPIFLQV